MNILITYSGTIIVVEKKTSMIGSESVNIYPKIFSMDFVSPLPQYCAARIEPPAVIEKMKSDNTKGTCAESETDVMASGER